MSVLIWRLGKGFIFECADDVTTPHQKAWLNGEVKALLTARDAAFRAGEPSPHQECTMPKGPLLDRCTQPFARLW